MKYYTASELIESGKPPSFDDVLLVPRYTEVRSRLKPCTQTSLGSNLYIQTPIVSSPMDTVTDSTMAISIGSHGAMGIVHRFMPIEEQMGHIKSIIEYNQNAPTGAGPAPVVAAIGVGDDERDRFFKLHKEYGLHLTSVAIDVANGHSNYMREMIKWVKDISNGDLHVIAGNVATGSGFAFLSESGADAVRVGIGGGSICKTRIMTGVGVPTLASVADAYAVKRKDIKLYNDTAIIADGGIRYPADLVKSLAAGADAIMAGRIFAGTVESPGEVVSINGESMKAYRGMASKEVQDDKRGGLRPGTCAEGVSTYIPLKGKAYYIIDEFCGGLRSAMTYLNANNIDELKDNALFMRLTASSLEESHAFGTRK